MAAAATSPKPPVSSPDRRHHALQRLIVRMQFDPGFADALLGACRGDGVAAPLASIGLGEREQAWLHRVDPRVFHHDPLKRRRMLHGLMAELNASSAIALAETRRIAFLDGFFTSRMFHEAVQGGLSLLGAFADFLRAAGLRTPQLPLVIAVEAELGRCRRALEAAGGVDWQAPPVPNAGLTHVARAPGVAVGRHSPDALAAIQCVEAYLFEAALVPALALVDDAPALVLPEPTARPPIPLGFIPRTGSGVIDIALVELEEPLYAAIAAVDGPAVPVARIGREMAESLVDAEVLVAAAV